MSYILDALRKSEQEREGSAVPILRAPPRTITGYRRLPPAVSAGAALIIAASAVAWLIAPELLHSIGSAPTSQAPPDQSPETAGPRVATPVVEQGSRSPSSDTAAVQEGIPRSGAETGTPAAADSGVHPRVADLSLTVVSYSDSPQRRFVMIDQRIVRESEPVTEGVVVKRILPNGVILGVGEEEVLLEPR
ncbi:MAG: general secretion pathway protein GspB [Gammaproteobacteria bacterium]|nr:general secretion pathway protein GspB [Gammaproteobacteria bacterium]